MSYDIRNCWRCSRETAYYPHEHESARGLCGVCAVEAFYHVEADRVLDGRHLMAQESDPVPSSGEPR